MSALDVAEVALLPAFASQPLTVFERTMLGRFRRGEDTAAIGVALQIKESEIYNRLSHARSIERARTAAGVSP